MDTRVIAGEEDVGLAFNQARPKSAASWGAIVAGSLVAIAMSLVLMALGAGLGFAWLSPWPGRGPSAGTFAMTGVIWLIVTQWVCSIFGGYITGRLRTRWIGTHEHEIFFRDTANGLVTWALSTLAVAILASSFVSSSAAVGAKSVLGVAASGAQTEAASGRGAAGEGAAASRVSAAPGAAATGLAYGIDKLFRSNGAPGGGGVSASPSATSSAGASGQPAGDLGTPDPRTEAAHILVNDLASGSFPESDRAYLVHLVASHTGLTDADAQKRVNHLIDTANAAEAKVTAEADVARKDGAEVAIYTALALLIGAFIASASAALGGRLRDEHI